MMVSLVKDDLIVDIANKNGLPLLIFVDGVDDADGNADVE